MSSVFLTKSMHYKLGVVEFKRCGNLPAREGSPFEFPAAFYRGGTILLEMKSTSIKSEEIIAFLWNIILGLYSFRENKQWG